MPEPTGRTGRHRDDRRRRSRRYAANSWELLSLRQAGRRPSGPVAVTLDDDGFVPGAALTLYVHDDMPRERMDWRMLVNLDVWLCVSRRDALADIVEVAYRIARCRPADLIVRFEEGEQLHDVRVGTGLHTPAVFDIPESHSFCWCPLNCSLTALAERLCWALLTKLPRWAVL